MCPLTHCAVHSAADYEPMSTRLRMRQYSNGINRLAERLARSSSGGFKTAQQLAAKQETIMVVDDNPMVNAILQRALITAGFKVIVAVSAEKALEHLVRPHSVLPSVLILDVFFGPTQMTGVQVRPDTLLGSCLGLAPGILETRPARHPLTC